MPVLGGRRPGMPFWLTRRWKVAWCSGSGGGPFGTGALIQDLNNLGVLTSPVIAGSTSGATSTNTTVAQLQTDQQASRPSSRASRSSRTSARFPCPSCSRTVQALGQDW